jgi:hypothetical protein
MDRSVQIRKSMKNAEASLNMERLFVSDESRELCFQLLNQEITFEEYLSRVKTKLIVP